MISIRGLGLGSSLMDSGAFNDQLQQLLNESGERSEETCCLRNSEGEIYIDINTQRIVALCGIEASIFGRAFDSKASESDIVELLGPPSCIEEALVVEKPRIVHRSLFYESLRFIVVFENCEYFAPESEPIVYSVGEILYKKLMRSATGLSEGVGVNLTFGTRTRQSRTSAGRTANFYTNADGS
jgi:hypothetical protein